MSTDDLQIRASLDDELTGPLKVVEHQVKEVGDAVDKTDRKAVRHTSTLSKLATGAGKVGKVLAGAVVVGATAAGAALAAATVAAGLLGVKLISLAMDAAETESKFRTVFGKNAAAVDAWVKKTNAAYGITTKSLQDVASRFGVFGKAAGIATADLPGFSTSLAQAGLDLASFYNVDPEEAFLALSSGLAGEAEPLRRFGIFLSDATMKAEAATMGLTGELTESQKVAVRQRLILKNLGDANGDLARTSDSLANKWRALKGRVTELGTSLGKALLPAGQKAANFLDRKLSPIVNRAADNSEELGKAFSKALDGKGIGPFAVTLDKIAGGGGRVEAIVRRVYGAFAGLKRIGGEFLAGWRGDPLGPASASLSGAETAGGFLRDTFDNLKRIAGNLATIWTDAVIPALDDLGPAAAAVLTPFSALDDVTGYLADHTEELRPILVIAAATWVAYQAAAVGAAIAQWNLNAAMAANPIGITIIAIGALAAGLYLLYTKVEPIRRAVDWLWQAFQRVGKASFSGLKSALRWIGDKIATIQRAWNRIKGGIGGVISKLNPFGDTARPRAASGGTVGGNLARTSSVHAAIEAATPGRRTVTSTLRGHALGSANSDHATGKARDLVGSGLGAYKRNVEAAGGFAEFHGSGANRHLHTAIGDTSRPRATSSSSSSGGGTVITIAPGAVVVSGTNLGEAALGRAVAQGIRTYERERRERGARR